MSSQPVAERQLAETQLNGFIAALAPENGQLIAAMRRWVRKRLPSAHELVYEYSDWLVISYAPTENGYDGVLAIRANASGVALYFNHGKGLPDPERLLRGSAKLVRFIQVASASMLAQPAVARLVDEVIARNAVPFAPSGRGPVVIKSSKARKLAPLSVERS